MNRRSFLVGAVAFAAAVPALAVDPDRGATPLGTEILLFERAVNWNVVAKAWVQKRPGWMQKVADSTDPRVLALAVAELETNMGWESVDQRWKQRRESWLAEVQKAASIAAAARLLLELESMTQWSAVQPAWKQARDPWVARVSALAR